MAEWAKRSCQEQPFLRAQLHHVIHMSKYNNMQEGIIEEDMSDALFTGLLSANLATFPLSW